MININSDKYVISPYDPKTNMLNSLKEFVDLEQGTVHEVIDDELTIWGRKY